MDPVASSSLLKGNVNCERCESDSAPFEKPVMCLTHELDPCLPAAGRASSTSSEADQGLGHTSEMRDFGCKYDLHGNSTLPGAIGSTEIGGVPKGMSLH